MPMALRLAVLTLMVEALLTGLLTADGSSAIAALSLVVLASALSALMYVLYDTLA